MHESVTAMRFEAVPLSSRPSLHSTNTAWLNGTATAETMTNRTFRIATRARTEARSDAHIGSEGTRSAAAPSGGDLERAGPRHLAEPPGARLGGPGEGLAVDRDEAEGGPVAVGPLEVVQRRPVGVPEDLDALVEAVEDALEGPLDVGHPAAVVLGGDPVLGHQQGRPVGHLPRPADAGAEGLGPELVAHDRGLHPLLGPHGPVRPHP